MATKQASWWIGKTGRRVVGGVAALGVTGAFLRYYLPNTHFLQNTKEITQLYRNGMAIKPPPKVKTLVQEVLNDLGLNEAEQKLIEAYTVYGFDPYHAGTTKVETGGIVGIPVSFQYTCEEDFDHTGIVINNEPVAWSSPAGQSLKAALVLSDEAKKFALAREITTLRTAEPFYYGLLASSVISMIYLTSSGINRKQNFYARPRSLRLTLYMLVGSFGLAFWALGKDVSTVEYETEADKVVGELGEAYARGGLEFYEKTLLRNVALRSLMGEKGEKLYTAFGNDQLLIRTRHQPFTVRRDTLKEQVSLYEKGEMEKGIKNDGSENNKENSVTPTKENSVSSSMNVKDAAR